MEPVVERALPSGRTLVLRIGSAGEDVEIRSAAGELDLRITLTDKGPVVSLRGARLELDAADVAFRCRDFDVQATGTAQIVADELRAKTTRDIHLNGEFIRLNCSPASEAEAQARMAQAEALMAAQAAAVAFTPVAMGETPKPPAVSSDPCCTPEPSKP
jgi:hypothetical protein